MWEYPKYLLIPKTSSLPEISGNTLHFGLLAARWFSKLNRVRYKKKYWVRVGLGYPLDTGYHISAIWIVQQHVRGELTSWSCLWNSGIVSPSVCKHNVEHQLLIWFPATFCIMVILYKNQYNDWSNLYNVVDIMITSKRRTSLLTVSPVGTEMSSPNLIKEQRNLDWWHLFKLFSWNLWFLFSVNM